MDIFYLSGELGELFMWDYSGLTWSLQSGDAVLITDRHVFILQPVLHELSFSLFFYCTQTHNIAST